MNYRLIGLHNHQIQFELDNEVYLVHREDLENKFNLYWFMGDLYEQVILLAIKNPNWFKKYKI